MLEISYLYRNYKAVLAVVSVVLFITSLIVHEYENWPIYRGLRGVASFAFLGLLLLFNLRKINYYLVGFLFFYGASSFATIWYENNIIAIIAMALNFIAFVFLILEVYPKVSFVKMDALFTIFFLVMVLFNGYLLYEFTEMIRDFTLSNAHYIFMLLGAMSLVVVAYLTLLSNYHLSSEASLVFTLFVFCMIFCEIFRAIGYYNFAYGDFAVYIARALLIFGSSLCVHFTVLVAKSDMPRSFEFEDLEE